ncbi:2-oxoglutarate-dependent dioxygenase 11-like [Malus domestica]|uniref:2-oxoglutarate-dependent dioxygenase 11-like n=1 Tax=Malus domestica TaxID=3750 RepID=UPI003976F6C8
MELLGSKTVQAVLIQGEQVPKKYIHKVENSGVQVPDASAAQLIDVPVIDLALLTTFSISADELEKLRSALATWGCFQVINHGMSSEFLNEVREIAKQFFALPVEDKKKYLRQVNDIQGYGNDMVFFSEQQTLKLSDRLYLSMYPQDNRKLNLWPENPKSFRLCRCRAIVGMTKARTRTDVISPKLSPTLSAITAGFLGERDLSFTLYSSHVTDSPSMRVCSVIMEDARRQWRGALQTLTVMEN